MFEAFDHAKELVEKNPGTTAVALAAAGLALYLGRGQIMSLFKPSAVEAGEAFVNAGTEAGVVGRAGLKGSNEIKEFTVHLPVSGRLDNDFAAHIKGIAGDAGLIRLAPQSAEELATRLDPAGLNWTTVVPRNKEVPLSAFTEHAARGITIGPIMAPLVEDGVPLANRMDFAAFDRELRLAREAGVNPIATTDTVWGAPGGELRIPDVHWRLPNSRVSELDAGLIKPGA